MTLPRIVFLLSLCMIGVVTFRAMAFEDVEDTDIIISMEEFWLEAESQKAQDAFDTWQAIYQRHLDGEALPQGITHDSLVLNMVYSALQNEDISIAEEFSALVRNKDHRLFTQLYIARADALSKASQADVHDILLRHLPYAKKELKGERFYDWLNALTTALLDVADRHKGDVLVTQIRELLPLQKTGRHRAYMLHRLAILENDETQNTELDVETVSTALDEGDVTQAYALLANAALSKQNKARNKWLVALHEKSRETKHQDIALHALFLIDSDSTQTNALIDYVDWLIEKKELSQATDMATALKSGKDAVRAYKRFAYEFKKLKMGYFRKHYERRVQEHQSGIVQAALPHESQISYSPFKTINSGTVLFDVAARKQALRQGELKESSEMCFAPQPNGKVGEPIKGFKTTSGYGADRRSHKFAWEIMTQAGRSLAGDEASTKALKELLLSWKDAKAFGKTQESHNAYFSLKRILYPLIISFSIVQSEFSEDEQRDIIAWLDPIVRQTDKKFGGKVDDNNHRFMADAALMAWGVVVDDAKLYHKGIERMHLVLSEMREDGSLPLETRRGNRSIWYMRQSLASLTAIAEMGRLQGDDLFALEVAGKGLPQMLSFFMNAANNPLIAFPYAAENLIPGHHYNVFEQDLGMLKTRGHGRHYMAFAESWLAHQEGFVVDRLQHFMDRRVVGTRPFIDEFSGGNVSCYWWQQ